MSHVLDAPERLADFRTALENWFEGAARDLPWRRTSDPYRVWLSEVILQQTRIDQGLGYYERFVERFPTVQDLAAAELDEVIKTWEGLGYYSRARNLHTAARLVVDEYDGRVPDSYDELLRLPGIGPYTAAAIASIAFGEAKAVLDGNVIRVISRLTALDEDVTRSAVRRRLQQTADTLLDPDRPGIHNEAMMELGALVCSPTSPECEACPVSSRCAAFASGRQEEFPVKKPKAPVPHYEIAVGIIRDDEGRILIQKRPEEAMLGGLWEFPGGKQEPDESLEQTAAREIHEELGARVEIGGHVASIPHAYSHFRITLHAYECRLSAESEEPSSTRPIKWVARERLADYAFPRANRRLIESLSSDGH